MKVDDNQLVVVTLNENPEYWELLGFSLSREKTGRSSFMLGQVKFVFTPASGPKGISSVKAFGINGPIDSLPFKEISNDAVQNMAFQERSSHRNAISKIDHLVVTTADCDRTTSAFESAGFPSRRVRRFGNQENLTRQTFFWLGDVILELVGPDSPSGSEQPAFWGLALVSENIAETLSVFGDLCTPLKQAVQAGRSITTVKTGDIGISVPIAVMTPHH